MPLSLTRLRPRDDTLYVSQNETVMATDRDGLVRGGAERGLFFRQTRLISKYVYLIRNEPLLPVALSNVEQHSWLGYYIAEGSHLEKEYFGTIGPGGKIAQRTIELRVSRYVGDGLHEDLDLTNFTQRPQRFEFRILLDADFADIEETRGRRRQYGTLTRRWNAEASPSRFDLEYDYRAEHTYEHQGERGKAAIHRGVIFRFERPDNPPSISGDSVSFDIELPPAAQWHCCVNVLPVDEGVVKPPLYACRSFAGGNTEYDRRRQIFLTNSTRFVTASDNDLSWLVGYALERGKHDLAALRLQSLDKGDHAWTLAAGLPVYLALFGRDTLTTSWQAALVSPDLMRGTLSELARLQGENVSDWREEQPGRMLHQVDTGPLAMLNYSPLGRYYSSITTSGFYPFVASQLWHWTGDKDLVRPYVEPSLRALEWLNKWSDRDRDGFYDYDTPSEHGNQNQGWKDSGDAIVDEEGRNVFSPLATCEEQAFVYAAKLHLSEMLWSLDDKDTARRLFHEAGELKKRFNERFWMEEQQFFAMALNTERKQVRSIGSNAGHCVASGIVDRSLVKRTVERLFADDMFSGWGIRTLSSKNPAYNPYSYHRGSIWPVEQGTFALGFMRYGLHEFTDRIARAQFEASALFDFQRLPELFAGHQRDADHPFPALYPRANSPQAWSASALFSIVQALLGIYPYAPLRTLLLDPHLPEWLPKIRVANLHVGEAVATIDFWRREDGSSTYSVADLQGTLHVIRQPSPWSLTATAPERIWDVLTSLVPVSRDGNSPKNRIA